MTGRESADDQNRALELKVVDIAILDFEVGKWGF